MKIHQAVRGACLALLCGFALSACAAADASPSLSEVKAFDGYHVYYAGAEVAGLGLESIAGDPSEGDSCCTFFYGTCTPGPSSEGSCAPPLEIQVFDTCRRWFSALSAMRPLYDFRGAKATGGKGGLEGGSPIEVFTGHTTVVIWGESPSVLHAAAGHLKDVHAAGPQAHLPPPAPGSLRGKLPCQRKPG